MHDLIPLADTGAVVTYAAEHDAIRAFADAEKAPSTRAAYRADFVAFGAWCRDRGLVSMPADPQAVAWHISNSYTGPLVLIVAGLSAYFAHQNYSLQGGEPADHQRVQPQEPVLVGVRSCDHILWVPHKTT